MPANRLFAIVVCLAALWAVLSAATTGFNNRNEWLAAVGLSTPLTTIDFEELSTSNTASTVTSKGVYFAAPQGSVWVMPQAAEGFGGTSGNYLLGAADNFYHGQVLATFPAGVTAFGVDLFRYCPSCPTINVQITVYDGIGAYTHTVTSPNNKTFFGVVSTVPIQRVLFIASSYVLIDNLAFNRNLPNLTVTAMAVTETTATPGGTITITDTVRNGSTTLTAGASTNRYYLDITAAKTASSVRLTGSRAVPALGLNATHDGTATLTVPNGVVGAHYYVVACADDLEAVVETDESDNCRPSSTRVRVSLKPTLQLLSPAPPVVPGSRLTFAGENYGSGATASCTLSGPNGFQSTELRVADGTGRINWEYATTCDHAAATYTAQCREPAGELSNQITIPVADSQACPREIDVAGKVTNQKNGQVIAGARVQIGTHEGFSDASGNYSIRAVPFGTHAFTASADGYFPMTSTTVLGRTSPQVVRDVQLEPRPGEITVLNVDTPFPPHALLPTNMNLSVPVGVIVDWNGHAPGKILFKAGSVVRSITATGQATVVTMNLADHFPPCTDIVVTAEAGDSAKVSPAFLLPYRVVAVPGALEFLPVVGPFWESAGAGKQHAYTGLSFEPFKNVNAPSKALTLNDPPAGFPKKLFGVDDLKIKLQLKQSTRGDYSIAADLTLSNLIKNLSPGLASKVSFLGVPRTIGPAVIGPLSGGGFAEGRLQYQVPTCSWQGSVSGGGVGSLSGAASWPFPLGPVPAFFRISTTGNLRLGGRWTASSAASPADLQLLLKLEGKAEGSLGVGISGAVAAEGFAAAQAEGEWLPFASKWSAKAVLSAGVRMYLWIYQIFSYEKSYVQMEWAGDTADPSAEVPAAQPPRLADRDYLLRAGHRERPPLPAADLAAPLSNAKHSQVLTVEGDVYPRSGATLSAQGARTIAAWLADDEGRSSVNRTRVQFAESTSAAPLAFGAAAPIAGDGTADFHPVALALPDRRDVVIYQNVKSVLPDTATLEQMAAGMDIAVSERNPATNAWTTTALSADTTYDGPPRIAGPGADNLIAVWPSNPANDFFGGPSKPWTFYWRARTAGGWSARQAVAAFPYGIAGYDLHYQDGRARLIVAADLDGLIGTVDDRELFAIAFDGTSWASSFTRLTSDTVGDENPVSFLDAAGEVQVAWLRSGAIRMAPLADPQLAVDVAPAADSSNAVGGTWTRSANGDAALVWVDSLNGQTDVMMVRRNSAGGDWSERIQLTEDTAVERYAAAAIRGDGQIVAIYNRLRSAPAVGTAEVVDLYALRNELVTDVALAAGSLQLRPLNPRAGEVVTGTLTVENVGGQPVSGLEVAVKVTSGSGSGEVARQSLAQLAAGASDEIEFTFTAPDGLTALAATADPDEHVADVDRANNMLTLSLGLTDLWVSDLRVSPNSDGTLGLTARVVNIGAADAAASAVVFRAGGVDGAVLGAATVPALAMGQESDVTATWNGAGTTPKPFIFVATADEAATLTEFDESNNRIEIRFGVSEPVGTIASELAATVSLRGAALDLGARASGSGTGASAVRVSVKAGGVEITSLDASYGASRPEIAALYGAQFLASGYEVTGIALAPGVYDVTVSALSAISGQRVVVATDRITISTAVPVAPTNLASTVRGSTVTLSWQAPASGAAPTGYVIEGGSAQGRADLAVLPTGSTATTITVPGVPAGAFFVRVRGVNQAGQGAASPDIVVTVGGVRCPVPPGAPTNLQSTVTGRQVRLAWTGGDGLCAATGFVVQAGSAKGLSNIAAITVAAAPTVLDVIDVPVGTYFVRLVAINGSGASAASNEVRLDVGGGCPSPSAPGGLVSTVAPDRTVALTWQVPTAAVTGVQIEAGSASGSANLAVLPLSGTATSYSTVAPPGKYFVRVRASNACGLGDASNEVVVIVP